MAEVRPTKIAQVAVMVLDLARAKDFYRDMLGLSHLFDAPPGLSFFQCGETRLMLSEPEGTEGPGNSILYFGVEDVAAAHRAMVDRGISFEEAPKVIAQIEGRDLWLAVCRDSEGNRIGLISG